MQFIYIDESGTGNEAIAVMTGIIADSHRMRLTKADWDALLVALSSIVGQNVAEIHTRDFYSGNSIWRNLRGTQRSEIINQIFEWLRVRKHSIVYSAIDKKKFAENFNNEPFKNDISTIWRFLALHLSLSIQKCYQGAPRGNKRIINPPGNCILIFDNENQEEKRFTDLLLDPPDWTDSYYDRKPSQDRFSQIVDVPHFVDSKDVGLIQLADFLCFFLRKYLEMKMGYTQPDYDGELEKVTKWAEIIFERSIEKRNMYISRGRCPTSDLFYRYAPIRLLEF